MNGNNNGMNGGSVILAAPGDNYTQEDGLDLSLGTQIHEYVIEGASGFDHWKTPVVRYSGMDANVTTNERAAATMMPLPYYTVDATECFTSLTFHTDSIAGQRFNLTGSDILMWAGNERDRFMGYHSSRTRTSFTIDWPTGLVTLNTSAGSDINVPLKDSAAANSFSQESFLWPFAAIGVMISLSGITWN